MKPSRPPIRAMGNAMVLQAQNFDQRVQRHSSTQGLAETKPLIRHLSQNHDQPPQSMSIPHFPQQRQMMQQVPQVQQPPLQRGHSPTIINRLPLQENYVYNNFQNFNPNPTQNLENIYIPQQNTQKFNIQTNQTNVENNYQPQQNNYKIPTQINQQNNQTRNMPLDISVKQSYIIHPQLQSPRQQHNNDQHHPEIKQKDQIIKAQSDQIINLQQSLSEKVHQFQQLQDKFSIEFKKFQDDFTIQLNSLELNVQMNDYTQLFMNEIDRKVSNLQNNINDQIKELQNVFNQKQQLNEHLTKNLQANACMRISEDEAYFKGEFEIVQQKLDTKIDRTKAEQLINTQLTQIQNQYQQQLQQAQQLLNKINTEKTDELKDVKLHIQATLEQLNTSVSNQLQMMFDMVNEYSQSSSQQKQEKKAIQQQLSNLSNKFQVVQQSFIEKQDIWKRKMKKLESEKNESNRKLEQLQLIIEQQQKEIEKLNNKVVFTQGSPITYQMSPPLNKHSSFFSNSTTTAQNITRSKRPRITSITQKELNTKNKNRSRAEISLDDFADFNENSLNDSSDSVDINQTCGFNKSSQKILNEFQSPPRNPFHQSQLVNINKMLSEDQNAFQKCKSNSRNKSVPTTKKLTQVERAIQRRLLVQGQSGKTLLCQYSPGQHLSDANMGIYLLDENDEPFQITEKEVDQLVQSNLIRLMTK